MSLHHLLYVSQASAVLSSEELEELADDAARNNARLGITGLLLFSGGHFMQLLEGEVRTVTTLFGAISRDVRHRDVRVLLRGPVEEQLFEGWSMGLLNLEDRMDLDRRGFHAVLAAGSEGSATALPASLAAIYFKEFRRQLPEPGAMAGQRG